MRWLRLEASLTVERWHGRYANPLWAGNSLTADGWRILGFNLGSLLVRLWVRRRNG